MTVFLMNSAVIPSGEFGVYSYLPATWAHLTKVLRSVEQQVVSRIGYEQTAALIERQVGVRVKISRETSSLAVGDVAYVVRMPYRVADPSKKGAPVALADNEWELGVLTRLS